MKNKFLITIILMTICVAVFAGSVAAQGLSSIMEKIETLERQVRDLQKSRKSDLAIIEKKLAEMKESAASAGEQVDISGLEIKISKLAAALAEIASEVSAEEEQVEPEVESCSETVISGFVDASYFTDFSSGDNSFGFDQVEIDVERTIDGVGSVRADLEWVNDGEGGFALDAEQGYVVFSPDWLGPVSFSFGKFNAPIGFELLDAPDMYQYSHALVFDNGLPTNVTGAMFGSELGQGFDITAYVCNGWDQNVELNTGKTVGGRLGYTLDEKACVGLSAIHGAQNEDEGLALTIVDLDLTLTPVEGLTIGGEFNYGNDAIDDSTSHTWSGFLVMTHYDFTESFGLTFRYDFFNDADNSRFADEGVDGQKRQAIALAPTFVLGDGMGALVELRVDLSDEEVFTDKSGEPAKYFATLAFEMTYTF